MFVSGSIRTQLSDSGSRCDPESVPPMTYAKSLRTMGQLLESANIVAFELIKTGQYYIVQSDSLTRTGKWILRNALSGADVSVPNGRPSAAARSLCFTQPDISRLDAQGKRRRREHCPRKRKAHVNCRSFCVAWAIILTKEQSSLFTFLGLMNPFLPITREPMGRATAGRLLRKNCSS